MTLVRSGRRSCPRRYCSNVSGPTPSSPRPISRTWWPRFARRSATGREPRVRPDRARVRLRVLRRRHTLPDALRRRSRATVVLARVGPAALSAVGRRTRHRTRSGCRGQARRVDGVAASRAAGGHGRRDGARGFRQQERHVSRQRARHVADPARRRRRDPHRVAAGDLPRARAMDQPRRRCGPALTQTLRPAMPIGSARSVPTRSSDGLAPAAWARSIAPAIRGSVAKSRSS